MRTRDRPKSRFELVNTLIRCTLLVVAVIALTGCAADPEPRAETFPTSSPLEPDPKPAITETKSVSGNVGPTVLRPVLGEFEGNLTFSRPADSATFFLNLSRQPDLPYRLRVWANTAEEPVISVDVADAPEFITTIMGYNATEYRVRITPFAAEAPGYEWDATIIHYYPAS